MNANTMAERAASRAERAQRHAMVRSRTEPIPNRQEPQDSEEWSDDDEGSSFIPSTEPTLSSRATTLTRSAVVSRSLQPNGQPKPDAALLMAQELLHHRPAIEHQANWLACITELLDIGMQVPTPSQGAPTSTGKYYAPEGGQGEHRPATRHTSKATHASHTASSPHDEGTSCQIIRRTPEDARVTLERHRDRQARMLDKIAEAGRRTRIHGVVTICGGCLAFTKSLRRVVWPARFKPDIPAKYDGSSDPGEFLQIYTVGVEAAGGDQRILANWFPMALSQTPRTWLMNLPEESIDSWRELCYQFVANFKGATEQPPTLVDLRRVRQRPGETLYKFMQCFAQVQNMVPRIPDAAFIAAFREGVTDVKMCEKLAVNDDISTALELFEMAERCAKPEAGRLFLKNGYDADDRETPSSSKYRGIKDTKRKTSNAVLAAEPERKLRCEANPEEEPEDGDGPYCAYHKRHTHSTEDCKVLRKIQQGKDDAK